MQAPFFAPIQQHLYFPPLITLLQDHQVPYKIKGIQLLKHMILENSQPHDIQRTGLGELLIKV